MNTIMNTVALAAAALACTAAVAADAPAGKARTDQQLIKSAMSAAPRKVGAGATIVVADKNIKKAISFFISHYVLLSVTKIQIIIY